jgi:hypothetical protein
MRILHLDYQRSYRPFPILGVVLLVCTIVVVLQIARQYLHFAEVLAAWEAREDQVERIAGRHNVGVKTNRQDTDQVSREVMRANEVLYRISLPWDELFRAVETAAPKHVALLAMEPDSDKRLVKIVAEAKDSAAMLDYIRILEGGLMFRTVMLQSHQVQQQDPQRPIRFSVIAAWKDRP